MVEALLRGGDNLSGAIGKGFAQMQDLTYRLYEKGIFLYVVLIFVGFAIHYVLKYFIGLKLGRERYLKSAREQ